MTRSPIRERKQDRVKTERSLAEFYKRAEMIDRHGHVVHIPLTADESPDPDGDREGIE